MQDRIERGASVEQHPSAPWNAKSEAREQGTVLSPPPVRLKNREARKKAASLESSGPQGMLTWGLSLGLTRPWASWR